MPEKYPELARNMPGNVKWEGSFYERLTEYGEWNEEAFWKLHREFIEVAKSVNDEPYLNKQLVHMLMFIQQRVLNLIAAHFNVNDSFQISNLSVDLVHEFKERFEMAVIGVVTGEVFSESSFDLKNPLLMND